MSDSANFFSTLAGALRDSAQSDWSATARPNQLPPPGDWRIWLLLAGRGFGKTRTVCEWVRAQVESGAAGRIALVAATSADVRDVIVEGESGILAISPTWNRPTYEPSKRRLTWPNGAIATCYSADEPERLRGPQHDAAVCDELAAWRYPEAWDQMQFGLRIGANPRVVVATTPKPTKLLRDLLAREGRDVIVTRGSTLENRSNLAPAFIEQITARYRGTRLGRQELDGEMLEDVPGALWTRETIEASRVGSAPQHQQRVVIAIDPAGSNEEGSDETGIICAAIGADGEGYVLADLSGRYAPTDWARRAIAAFYSLKADKIVIERNFGGDMAAATIASLDPSVPVKEISSSRGKVLRAEPISSLFEQRRAHLVGTLPELEDQMAAFTADWDRARDGSPDRVDALVFAMTELLLGQPLGGFIHEAALLPPPVDGAARPPIELPAMVDGIFASAAAGVGPEPDAIGVVYFACSMLFDENPPVLILDWDIEQISSSLDAFTSRITRRLAELNQGLKFSKNGGLLLEPSGMGDALLAHAYGQGIEVQALYEEKYQKMLPAERVVAAGGFVAGGHVLMARPAHEKISHFKGVLKNHLLAEVTAFGVEQQAQH